MFVSIILYFELHGKKISLQNGRKNIKIKVHYFFRRDEI